jgi:hypothetical protein
MLDRQVWAIFRKTFSNGKDRCGNFIAVKSAAFVSDLFLGGCKYYI